MTMHRALQPRDDIDRLNESRKAEGKVLASIKESVNTPEKGFEQYIPPQKKTENKETLITATRVRTVNIKINRPIIIREHK